MASQTGTTQSMPEKPDNGEKEKQLIEDLSEEWSDLKEGSSCFLISATWYQQWMDYVSGKEDATVPQEIDNSVLLLDEKSSSKYHKNGVEHLLKPGLEEKRDYYVVTEKAWTLLNYWYTGGPKILRKIITEGENKEKRVEVYHVEINAFRTTLNAQKVVDGNDTTIIDATSAVTIIESKKATIEQVVQHLCKIWNITPESEVRLWNYLEKSKPEPLWKQSNQTIDDVQIVPKQSILLEVKTENGWLKRDPLKLPKHKQFFSKLYNLVFSTAQTVDRVATTVSIPTLVGRKAEKKAPGVCGLSNLGNTCFMNSALQCLSNSQALTSYFITDNTYMTHINTVNPLGMRGNLAEQYAVTIRSMWSGDFSCVTPRNLKWILGKFAPRFSGTSQQDSQEFLAFLLDGLHEDLNLVREKPYSPAKDSDGRPDREVAEEAWQKHLRRNRSIIVDLFQAQLKSTLVCPHCKHVSITFDPFMYLSLPLPMKTLHEVTVIDSADPTRPPTKYGVFVSDQSTLPTIFEDIATLSGLPYSELMMVTVFSCRIQEMPSSFLVASKDRTQYIHRIPSAFHSNQRTHFIHQRAKSLRHSNSKTAPQRENIGIPFVFYLPTLTGRQLYFFVWRHVQRMLHPDFQDARFNKEESPTTCKNNNKTEGAPTPLPTEGEETSKQGESSTLTPTPTDDDDNNNNEAEAEDLWKYITEECQKDFDPASLPFILRHVEPSGSRCSECRKTGCFGCEIKPDDAPVAQPNKHALHNNSSASAKNLTGKKPDTSNKKPVIETIAIDWVKPEAYATENGNYVEISESLKEYRLQSMKKTTIPIEECLELFSETETLGENDKWYCPKCKDHVRAQKNIQLWSSPDILIIHLKRFCQSRGGVRSKISTEVAFPRDDFDLAPYLLDKSNQSQKYSLFGISKHNGSLHGGHYTALAKNINGNWYSFNDQTVSPISSPAPLISSSSAYLLFYARDKNGCTPCQ